MSASKLFTDYAVKLHRATDESGGAAYIDGIQSAEVSSGLQTLTEGGDGSLYNSFGSLLSAEPRATFTTNDLKAVLDKVSSFDAIDSDGTHPGVALYAQRYLSGGSRSSSSDALEVLFDKGMLVLRSIEMSHRQTALATVEVIGESADGSTSPVTFDEAAALPSAAATVASAWTLGKVDISGTQLEGVESVSIDFGVDVLVEAKDSDIFPTFVSARRSQPTIRVRCAHIDFTSSLTESGLYDASGVVLYARKRAEGGTFVADGTAEHISFTLGKCRLDWGSISGDPKMIEVTITPWNTEGGAAPIAISTTAAIT